MPALPLEPTAAFVMQLAHGLFRKEELTKRYYDAMDLSAADAIIDEHRRAGILELTSELMCDRKNTVRHVTREFLKENRGGQVVILASGKSPLGLELAAAASRVFEVDLAPAADKEAIYRRLSPETADKVKFVQKSVTDSDLVEELEKQGFDPKAPTITTWEGITHYLPEKTLQLALKPFRGATAVVEFGPPIESLTEEIRPKAREAFAFVEKRYFPTGMFKYSLNQLADVLDLSKYYASDEMEKLRLGKNRHFPAPNSGWVNIVVGKVR